MTTLFRALHGESVSDAMRLTDAQKEMSHQEYAGCGHCGQRGVLLHADADGVNSCDLCDGSLCPVSQ